MKKKTMTKMKKRRKMLRRSEPSFMLDFNHAGF
jgi:hypothetical protein